MTGAIETLYWRQIAPAILDTFKSGKLADNSIWKIIRNVKPYGSSSDTDGGAKFWVHYPVLGLIFIYAVTAKSNKHNSIQTLCSYLGSCFCRQIFSNH